MVVTRPTRARFQTLDFAMDLEEAIVLPLVRKVTPPAPAPLPVVFDKRRAAEEAARRRCFEAEPRRVPRLQSLLDAYEVERTVTRSRRRALVLASIASIAAALACAFATGLLAR